jgi:hypothetical protein
MLSRQKRPFVNLTQALSPIILQYQALAPILYTHGAVNIIGVLFDRPFAHAHLSGQVAVGCARAGEQALQQFKLAWREVAQRIPTWDGFSNCS